MPCRCICFQSYMTSMYFQRYACSHYLYFISNFTLSRSFASPPPFPIAKQNKSQSNLTKGDNTCMQKKSCRSISSIICMLSVCVTKLVLHDGFGTPILGKGISQGSAITLVNTENSNGGLQFPIGSPM